MIVNSWSPSSSELQSFITERSINDGNSGSLILAGMYSAWTVCVQLVFFVLSAWSDTELHGLWLAD
ncbi:hypothetical protein BDN67DRAFT_971000 [Paxillus ammoniavirescens]|nr:hypothetical protein BDN67DRAFT_971000 [Paxillus ammoniavirescens]